MKKNILLYLWSILIFFLFPYYTYSATGIDNQKIQEIVQNNQGQSALVTKQSGEIIAGYNNNVNPNYGGASTVKLIVADLIISRFNQGTIKLNDTISIPSCARPGEELNKGSWVVQDAIRNMLKDSGNSSTNALIYSITNSCDAKGINNLLGNYSSTKINRYLNLPGASPVLGSAGGNTTNANDVSKAMSRIFASSGEATNIAKTALQSSTDKLGINSIANKVGITSRVTGNVAIVEIANNRYIITVFVDGDNESRVTKISNDIIQLLNDNKDTVGQSTDTPTSSSSSNSSATTTAGTVSYQSYTNFPGVGRISDLCQLINALWLLGFAVLLTSVLGMFLYGGYMYVTAGVNAGKVNQAKEIFTNTITGLIIGLSIFIIINVINPGLLQGNCSIPPIGSTGTGAGQPTFGGPGRSVPGNRNCDGCVSLRSQGVTVADWNGTNGPGRTDKVMPQVAAATKRVQDEMASLGTPIHITAAWTNGVGHSSGSQHYLGLAVDIQPVSGSSRNNATLQQIANACRKAGFTFVLVESYHTHCDMR